jgi:hypothetical protein
VLAGFYPEPLSFAFPPAFMREARLRIAAEWTRDDLVATRDLDHGALSLDNLISHRVPAADAAQAYQTAFEDPACLKMILNWTPSSSNAAGPNGERRMSLDEVPNLKELRREAPRRGGGTYTRSAPGRAHQEDADHRDLRQGRHRQVLHARQPQPHDGRTGQARAADRLRPEIGHHFAAVWRQGLPDDHRDLARKKKLAARRSRSATSASSATACSPWSLADPEVGRGCGGAGIIHGFELLEKLGFHDWDFDYVLLDFLGDVVCGGFGLPIARDMAQKVIVVGSNDLQSLYVANNVCSAVEYFRKLGGNVGVAGLVINKDDGSGEAQAFAKAVDIPVLASIPQDDDLRKKSANYQIVGTAESQWGALFAALGENVAKAPPMRPTALTQDEFWSCSTAPKRARASRWSPPPTPTCAARTPSRKSLPRSDLRRGLREMTDDPREVRYDDAADAEVIRGEARVEDRIG